MAVHHFTSQGQLRSFFRAGRGFVLNHYRNCLHRITCDAYVYNPPGLNYTKTGFDTSQDVLNHLGRRGWYPCPLCNPRVP